MNDARQELEAALARERLTLEHYEDAVEQRKKIANEYFGMRYNAHPGSEIILSGGRRAKLLEFVMLTLDLDKRPGVIAVKWLPFGDHWSKDRREYGPKEWMAKDESQESVGNLK